MNTYIVNGVKVEADSFAEAFEKGVGDYVYKEVEKPDYCDVIIEGEGTAKYYWIRWG